MTDVERIARGLTKAQRAALLAMPPAMPFMPLEYAKQLPTIAVLRSKRLIRTVSDCIDPWAASIVSRPLGLAVRAHLEAQRSE